MQYKNDFIELEVKEVIRFEQGTILGASLTFVCLSL